MNQAAIVAQLVAVDAMLNSIRTSYEAQLDAVRQQLNAASTLLDHQIEASKTQVAALLEQVHAAEPPGCAHLQKTNDGTIGAPDWRCDECGARVPAPPADDEET